MEIKQIDKMSDADYFALQAISASQIKQFDKGPYWFWQNSPFNPQYKPDTEISDALAFGKLCHAMILEHDTIEQHFAIAEFGASRRNKKYAELQLQYPDKLVVSGDEYRHALMMRAKMWAHPLADAILKGATAELPYVWRDADTGLLCKQKTDAIKRTKRGLVVIDYKTSSDIDGLLKNPQKLQYPLQDDFYCRGIKDKYGEEPVEFVFIIQSSKEGEEDVIAVANVDYESRQAAHSIVTRHLWHIREKLDLWNKTHDRSIWAAYPERQMMRYSNWYLEQ